MKFGKENDKGKSDKYDKIKHLVEVDDDIHVVFIIEASQMNELYIAKISPLGKNDDGLIFNEMNQDTEDKIWTGREYKAQSPKQSILGYMIWIVIEYDNDNYRIFNIYEHDKIVLVIVTAIPNLSIRLTTF